MRRTTCVVGGALVLVAIGISAPGCGTGILPSDTIAEAAAKVPLLNQITVGDVVEGFQSYLNQTGATGDARGLDGRQFAQLESLQGQLDAGQISKEEFERHVQAMLGDAAPNRAFGGFAFFGSPFGNRFENAIADLLDLTEVQQQQAREIFNAAHTDIRALREAAHEQILAVLTPEQQVILEEIRQQGWLSFILFGRLPAEGAAPSARGERNGLQRFFDWLADELGLTDEQRERIRAIREELRTQVKARHMQAREEFRAILTDEQRAILDELEARRDERHGPREHDETSPE